MSRTPSSNSKRIVEVMKLLEEQRRNRLKFWSASAKKGKPHSERKEFDLDTVSMRFYGYRNALRRPDKSLLFSREVLIDICKYLECGFTQTNDILFVAGYRPEYLYPSGQEMEDALAICLDVLLDLPMPA
jgi:hypothetical protein